jgi:phosphoribosylcarboxyaminoimidazole (NCAIR) mutase
MGVVTGRLTVKETVSVGVLVAPSTAGDGVPVASGVFSNVEGLDVVGVPSTVAVAMMAVGKAVGVSAVLLKD